MSTAFVSRGEVRQALCVLGYTGQWKPWGSPRLDTESRGHGKKILTEVNLTFPHDTGLLDFSAMIVGSNSTRFMFTFSHKKEQETQFWMGRLSKLFGNLPA